MIWMRRNRIWQDGMKKKRREGISAVEESLSALLSQKKKMDIIMAASLILGVGGALAVAGFFKSIFFAMIIGVAGILAAAGSYILRLRIIEKLQNKERQKNRFLAEQEKLEWSRDSLREIRKEKETALENIVTEYQETEEHAYNPLAEEMEIEALKSCHDSDRQTVKGYSSSGGVEAQTTDFSDFGRDHRRKVYRDIDRCRSPYFCQYRRADSSP